MLAVIELVGFQGMVSGRRATALRPAILRRKSPLKRGRRHSRNGRGALFLLMFAADVFRDE